MEILKKKKERLFPAEFWETMLPLAIPIALQNLLMTSFRLVDTLMIGQLGDTSIAAVGLAGQLSFLVELIVFGMASGSAVFIAQFHGADNRDGIRRAFGAMLLFAVPCGLIATLVALLDPRVVMRILTNDPALVEEGARYLQYACVSYLGLTLYQSMAVTLRSTENVRVPMITSIIAAVTNAALNYGFIFGKLGLPEMGVAGAGLATAISAMLNPALMLIISVFKRNILIAPLSTLFRFRGFLRIYWSKVLPVLMNETLWSLSVVGINMVFGRMGADNYAALTVFRTVENIVFVFFVGICNACNILVGKSIGAGRIEEGKLCAKRFLLLEPLLGLILGALILLTRPTVIGLFDVSDTARQTAMTLLLIYALDVTLRNVPYIGVVGIFRAAGDARIGLVLDCVVQYALLLPVVYTCGLVLKLPFVLTYLIMLLTEDISKTTVTLIHYFRMRWIKPVKDIPAGSPDNRPQPADT